MGSKSNALVLFSGGKDSVFALYKAIESGVKISGLLVIKSKNPDSYMFHTPNISLAEVCAKAMQFPVFVEEVSGLKEDEVIELENIISKLKSKLNFDSVVSGAIKSNYQFVRIKNICEKLNLSSITPMWMRDENEYLSDLLNSNFDVVFVGYAAVGFDDSWLNSHLDKGTYGKLCVLNKKFGISIVGEGGEFESFVVDSPLHKQRIVFDEVKKQVKGLSGKLIVEKYSLIPKN